MPLAGALAVTAVLVALGVGIAVAGGSDHEPASSPAGHAQTQAAKRRAALVLAGTDPLRVRGTGFRARERVRVTVTQTGRGPIVRRVRATGRGTFGLALPGIEACQGVHGVAAGNRGSHASFQFSSIRC